MAAETPRTMLRVAAMLGVLTIGVAGLVMNQRRVETRTQQDLLRELQASTEAPDAGLLTEASFDEPIDKPLGERVHYIQRTFHGRITRCSEKWVNGPDETLVRIQTDEAGRLSGLAVQGAPDDVAECLVKVLDEAQFPRSADGVALLPLRYER